MADNDTDKVEDSEVTDPAAADTDAEDEVTAESDGSDEDGPDELARLEAELATKSSELDKANERHKSASDKISQQGQTEAELRAQLAQYQAAPPATAPVTDDSTESPPGVDGIDIEAMDENTRRALDFVADRTMKTEKQVQEYIASQEANAERESKYMAFNQRFGMDRTEFDKYHDAVARGDEVGAADMLVAKSAVQAERDRREKVRQASENTVPPAGNARAAAIMATPQDEESSPENVAKRINEMEDRQKNAAILELYGPDGHGDAFANRVVEFIDP